MNTRIFRIGIVFFLALIAQSISAQGNLPAGKIRLPDGFTIEVYASELKTARGLSFAPDGTLFVGSKAGEVYAVKPDGAIVTVTRGLNMPVGVDFFVGRICTSPPSPRSSRSVPTESCT